MKTIFLIPIIFVIGATAVAIFFYTNPPFAYYDVKIQGMKDTYHTGEKYSFYYTITGYGNTCHSWLVEYPDENGKIQRAGEAVDCTRPSNKQLDYDSRKDLRQFNSKMPIIEGKYNVTVSLENLESVIHEFTVASKKSLAHTTNSESQTCKGGGLCLSEKITRIIDGDTLYLGEYKIRLSLTNTPERHEIGFYDASKFTAEMCPVGSVALVDQDDLQPYDVYDRVLGKVVCSGKVLNSELLYAGHANILTKYCTVSEFSEEAWAQEFGC